MDRLLVGARFSEQGTRQAGALFYVFRCACQGSELNRGGIGEIPQGGPSGAFCLPRRGCKIIGSPSTFSPLMRCATKVTGSFPSPRRKIKMLRKPFLSIAVACAFMFTPVGAFAGHGHGHGHSHGHKSGHGHGHGHNHKGGHNGHGHKGHGHGHAHNYNHNYNHNYHRHGHGHGHGRWWHGQWWGYGVGSCWRWTPYGYVWICY